MFTTPTMVARTTSHTEPPPLGEPPLVVSIEGNIGVGKSTLMAGLRKRFASSNVVFLDEPVDLWERHGLLQAMYSGQLERCGFQQMAMVTRAAMLQKALTSSGAPLIITERSVYSDRECFARINLTKPCEAAAYAVTHDAVCSCFPPARHAAVFLDAPLGVISERICRRGREAETQTNGEDECAGGGVPDEYLNLLTAAHETYFASLPEDGKRAVDATRSPEEVAEEVYTAIVDLERSINPSSPQTVMAEAHKMVF